MAPETPAVTVPPVNAVLSELLASLAFAAHAYLEPQDGSEPDLEGAGIAIDVAAFGFDRIQPRLSPQERSAFTGMLTDLRMTYVKKRG